MTDFVRRKRKENNPQKRKRAPKRSKLEMEEERERKAARQIEHEQRERELTEGAKMALARLKEKRIKADSRVNGDTADSNDVVPL